MAKPSRLSAVTSTLSFRLFLIVSLSILVLFALYTTVAQHFQTLAIEGQVKSAAYRTSDVIRQSLYASMLRNERQRTHEMITLLGREPGVEIGPPLQQAGRDHLLERRARDRHAGGPAGRGVQRVPRRGETAGRGAHDRARPHLPEGRHAPRPGAHQPDRQLAGLLRGGVPRAPRLHLGARGARRADVARGPRRRGGRGPPARAGAGRGRGAALDGAGGRHHVPQRLPADPKLRRGTERLGGRRPRRRDPPAPAATNSASSRPRSTGWHTVCATRTPSCATGRAPWRTGSSRRRASSSTSTRSSCRSRRRPRSGRMAATVAHELNNPLSGILTYAKLSARRVGRLVPEGAERQRVLDEAWS